MLHNLIKQKLTDLIESNFQREGSLFLACNDTNAFFTSGDQTRFILRFCQNVCDALSHLLDNILDFALTYTDKLWEFRWVLIVLLL